MPSEGAAKTMAGVSSVGNFKSCGFGLPKFSSQLIFPPTLLKTRYITSTAFPLSIKKVNLSKKYNNVI